MHVRVTLQVPPKSPVVPVSPVYQQASTYGNFAPQLHTVQPRSVTPPVAPFVLPAIKHIIEESAGGDTVRTSFDSPVSIDYRVVIRARGLIARYIGKEVTSNKYIFVYKYINIEVPRCVIG